MIAFTTTGPLLGFTAATTAPTSVQAISLDNVNDQQIIVTNTDSTVDCVLGWADSDAKAKANASAAASTCNCYFLLHSTQIVITVPPGAYITGKTASSTAVIKVQAGFGN